MTYGIDGGWFTILLLGSLVIIGVLAFRGKGWSLPKLQKKKPTPPATQTAPPPPAASSKKSGINWGKWAGAAGSILGIILVVAVVIWLIAALMHSLTGGGQATTQSSPTAVTRSAKAAPSATEDANIRANALAERKRIESEDHVLTFSYGETRDWIRVPDGGYVMNFTVDDKKVVGVECSSSPEKPPADATSDQYDCHHGITGYWIRFSAWSADEGPVTVRYKFLYAF